jgi:hypothetical protein
VDEVLAQTGKRSQRERDLPAHVVVYYVIAMALYMHASTQEVLRYLLEGVRWLLGPSAPLKVAGRAAISRARARVGSEPLRELHDRVVKPIAVPATKGAWYRQWHLVSLDGTTLAVADTAGNQSFFGVPSESRGKTAYPLMRLVSLVENGTHVLFGTAIDAYTVGEVTIAAQVMPSLRRGMLCLADRNFFGYNLWQAARKDGADLLWRVKCNLVLPCHRRLPDGSYLSKAYPSPKHRDKDLNGVPVRVIEYQLEGVGDAEPSYRLVTTIMNHEQAPAEELAALYHERWEIENALDEFKTHLRGRQMVLRSKTPDMAKQEAYGLLMAHFAIRGLMHEAALQGDEDPDRLSFTHAVHVVRRKLPALVVSPPGEATGDPSTRFARDP